MTRRVYPSKRTDNKPKQSRIEWVMVKTILVHSYDHNTLNTEPFWMIFGSFWSSWVGKSIPVPVPVTHAGFVNLFHSLIISRLCRLSIYSLSQTVQHLSDSCWNTIGSVAIAIMFAFCNLHPNLKDSDEAHQEFSTFYLEHLHFQYEKSEWVPCFISWRGMLNISQFHRNSWEPFVVLLSSKFLLHISLLSKGLVTYQASIIMMQHHVAVFPFVQWL